MSSEARRKAVKKYNKEKCDQIKVRVPKGDRAKIAAYAKTNNESMNGMIVRLIQEEMERGAKHV